MAPTPEEQPRPAEGGEDGEDGEGGEGGEGGTWVDAALLEGLMEEGTLVRLDVRRAVGKGENYLSVLYRTRLEYRPKGSQETRVRNLIVKGLPEGEFMVTFCEEVGFFRRETAIYEEALPRLYAFADERLGGWRFKRITADIHRSPRPDTLILEDLRPLGFVMASRRERLDLQHSTLVVRHMARLHALSAAYDQHHPGYLQRFDDRMYVESNRERLNQFVPVQIKAVRDEICQWDGFREIADKLEVVEKSSVDKIIEITKPIEGGRNFLVHGDCWINNFLFKYSDSGKPIDFRFVDFQLTRYASPAMDLNYFVFSSPRVEVRERHFDDLLREYCDEFASCAKDLGYTRPMITVEEIRKEVDRTIFFGFFSVLTTMAVVLSDPDDTFDFASLTEESVAEGIDVFGKVYKSAAFKEAFQSILPYFDERGVFD